MVPMWNKWTLGLVLGSLLSVQAGFGDVFAEIPDAGDLTSTGQSTTGSPLTSITGTIGSPTDADLYAILLSGSTPFSATTCGTAGSIGDTQLFLFDSSGIGVLANDDDSGCGVRSTLPATLLSGGVYYLGISGYDLDPESLGGLIFPTSPFSGVFGPSGAGGGAALSGWSGGGDTGTYTIDLTGATPADGGGPSPVPEPASLLLLGTGLAGIASRLRKKTA